MSIKKLEMAINASSSAICYACPASSQQLKTLYWASSTYLLRCCSLCLSSLLCRAFAYYLQLAAIFTILLAPLGNDRILRSRTINRFVDVDGKGRSIEWVVVVGEENRESEVYGSIYFPSRDGMTFDHRERGQTLWLKVCRRTGGWV